MKKYFFLVLTLAAIACSCRQPAKGAMASAEQETIRKMAPACCLDHRSDIDKWHDHQQPRAILSSVPSPTYPLK